MNTDPIADFLTRIRNGSSAGLKAVEIPGSNTKRAMTQILFDQGYITNFKFVDDDKQGIIKIALKYNPSTKVPAITKINTIYRFPRVMELLNPWTIYRSMLISLRSIQVNWWYQCK